MKRIFISIPYTHEDKVVTLARVWNAEKHFMELLKTGNCPVSPIVVGHNLVDKYPLDSRFSFWEQFCISELATCQQMDVIMMPGWNESVGVKKEIEIATLLGLSINYVDPYIA